MKRLTPVLLVALLALVLGACGGDDGGGGGATGTSPDGGGGEQLKKIGLAVAAIDNPFYIALKEGAEAEAEKLGATVEVEDGAQDLNKQSQQFDDFIQRGVDAILVTAVDSKGIAPAVQRARDAGVPVIAVDIGAEGPVESTIVSDNPDAGRQACKFIADKLGGKGNVAILDGPPTDVVEQRRDNCKEVLAESPGIKIVATQRGDGSREQGRSLTTDIITANPDLDAIFAIGDPLGLGAELALKQANRDDVIVTAVDGAPEVVESMKADGLFEASSAQQPREIGAKGVQTAADIVAGKAVESDITIPIQLVTKENVDSYAGW